MLVAILTATGVSAEEESGSSLDGSVVASVNKADNDGSYLLGTKATVQNEAFSDGDQRLQ